MYFKIFGKEPTSLILQNEMTDIKKKKKKTWILL